MVEGLNYHDKMVDLLSELVEKTSPNNYSAPMKSRSQALLKIAFEPVLMWCFVVSTCL